MRDRERERRERRRKKAKAMGGLRWSEEDSARRAFIPGRSAPCTVNAQFQSLALTAPNRRHTPTLTLTSPPPLLHPALTTTTRPASTHLSPCRPPWPRPAPPSQPYTALQSISSSKPYASVYPYTRPPCSLLLSCRFQKANSST